MLFKIEYHEEPWMEYKLVFILKCGAIKSVQSIAREDVENDEAF